MQNHENVSFVGFLGMSGNALSLLRSKYDVMVQSLPSDYEKTLQVVQDHLTDDQICGVLTSPNYTIANKTILNCLMEKVKSTPHILEFCDQVGKITSLLSDPGILSGVINELRTGNANTALILCWYISPYCHFFALPDKDALILIHLYVHS